MRISDWSSDVCSSDLILRAWPRSGAGATPTATSSPPSDRNCQVNGLNDVVDGSVSKALLDNKALVVRSHACRQSCLPALARSRSEERRVGTECVSTCRSRWSQYQ